MDWAGGIGPSAKATTATAKSQCERPVLRSLRGGRTLAPERLLLLAVSWGNPAPQESTIDGSNMLGDLATPLRLLGLITGRPAPKDRGPSPVSRSQSSPCKERLLGLLLAVALIVPTVTVVTVVAAEWVSSPSQRGWLILGFGFYIMTAMRSLWGYFIQVYEGMFHLKVELRRLVCRTRFAAVTHGIAP